MLAFIVLLGVLFILYGISRDPWEESFLKIFFSIITIFTGFGVFFALASCINLFLPTNTINGNFPIYNIESMRPKDYVEGRFFFGSGAIDTEPMFQFLITKGNNSFYIKTVNAEGLNIVFTDEKLPSLCYTKKYIPKHTWFSKFILFPLNRNKVFLKFKEQDKVLYLPKNAIPIGFVVQEDIKNY